MAAPKPESESVVEAAAAPAPSLTVPVRAAKAEPEIVMPAPTVAAPAPPSSPQPKSLRERPFVLGPEPARPPATPPRARAGGGGAWLGWVLSLIILGLLVWGAYAYRGTIMQAWPPSERVYALLGLMPVPPR
jgi:hypothetical protein